METVIRRHYSQTERDRVVDENEKRAHQCLVIARGLEADGHPEAAGIQRGIAQVHLDIAHAARHSSDRLNQILNS